MSLESLPVINFTQCDPSTKNFIKHSVNVFAETLSKWDMQNDDLAIANRIVRRFKNQQRHFIHFAELCHLTRLLRKAGSGRGNFCLNYVIRGLEATEMNQCLSRNCIDFFLLALNSWQSEICVIRALCMSCWRHSERQMLTGHFVKLATLIIIVLARVLILAEKSILSSVEVYSSIYAIRSQVPNVGVAMDCLSRLPKKLEFESVIPLNERCIAFLNLPLKLLRKSKGKPSKSLNFLEMLFK
ncbi:expressed protein [Echinococcus multilocularis]|uniref:Expressed protein n=1 Tax=Echinococcus multilocularis TaxID=6211 RepID=A0A068Y637_ECHMU|nr:expressed protein [Echinococcus multilocularis]